MKRIYPAILMMLALLTTAAYTQTQHQHGQPASAPMQGSMMGAMGGHMQTMSRLMNELVASFDKVRAAQDPKERQAAMEEHARILAEFRKNFEEHHAKMAEHMKSCPMMEQQSGHPEHHDDTQEKK